MIADERLIDCMIAQLKRYPTAEKAVLFGSRARGDCTERSDYDIAVYGALADSDRARLYEAFREELPTLHKIDLIFMRELPEGEFKNSIEREGVIFYDAENRK